jgi:hypothetical protein
MRQIKITRLDYRQDVYADMHKKLVINEKFQSALKKIRAEFGIKVEELTGKRIAQLSKNPELLKRSKKLTSELGLGQTWQGIVHQYILWDEFYFPDYDPESIFLETRKENNKSEEEFYLRIFPHTSSKDIERVWGKIQKEISPNGAQRKRIEEKFNRNARISYLASIKTKVPEIWGLIKKEFGEDLDYGNIKVIISNYEKFRKGLRGKL